MKKYLFFVLLVGIQSCEDSGQKESYNNETSNDIILLALRARTEISFNKKTRDLNTLVSDSSSFTHISPNTDISCGHIIRYYFHTNIHLNQESNELISMDESVFRLDNFSGTYDKDYVINLSEQVITTIGDMYYGSSELQDFLNAYPDVVFQN